MPWVNTWEEPEVYIEHNGVTIYHTYKDNEKDQGARSCWYGWNEECRDDEPNTTFDVRELPGYDAAVAEAERLEINANADALNVAARSFAEFQQEYYKQVMRNAIDAGYLTTEGIKPVTVADEDRPWMQDPNAMETRFCPYCGEKDTLTPGGAASIEVYADDADYEQVGGAEPVETLGAQEQKCTACDTRFFSI